MKHLQLVLGCLALSVAFRINAQNNAYLGTDLGVNFAVDTETTLHGGGFPTATGETKFDTGLRFGVFAGEHFTRWFAIELETGFLYSPIQHSDSWLGNLPLLGNIVFHYDNDSGWIPYVGGGAGGSLLLFNVKEASLDEDDADIAIAWQLFAGVRYKVSDRFSIGLGYKYLRTTETEYSIGRRTIELDGMQNHSVGLTVTMDF